MACCVLLQPARHSGPKRTDNMYNERSYMGRKEEIQATAFPEAVGKIACQSMDHCQGQQTTVTTGAPRNSGSGL